MAEMDDVEAAVGKDDFSAQGAVTIQFGQKFFDCALLANGFAVFR